MLVLHKFYNYNQLLPFAKDYGVKIATENMWNWNVQKDEAKFASCSNPESFNAHLDAINDPYFVACLDLGHAEMRGLDTSAVEMIENSAAVYKPCIYTITIYTTILTKFRFRCK